MGLGAIDDLIDIVDGFSLAGAAPENEDAGHQVEVRIVFVVGSAAVGLFFYDQVRDEEKSYKGFIISTMVDRKCTGWEREKRRICRDFGSTRGSVREQRGGETLARVNERSWSARRKSL